MISYLIESKAYFSLCPHLETEFFLNMVYKGKTICEKAGTNLFTKFI